MKRKYPKVEGYWVYTIYVPSINKYYVGISKQKCCRRWIKSKYNGTVLEPYLEEWDSMGKTVLVDDLSTKEDALKKEDALIQELNNLCINERRSGLIYVNNKNGYEREYREENREQYNEYQRQWNKDNKEKRRKYDKQYRENNKEKVREKNKQYRENNKEQINRQQRQRRLKKKLEKQQKQ